MASPIQHRRDFEVEYGAVDELSPLIRRVECRNPGPFTFKGTGTYIVGRGEVAVIDPGPAVEAHLERILGALGPDESVSHILITHTHSDHSPGAAWLKEKTGARTYGYGPHGKVGPDDPNDKVDFSKYFTTEEKARYDKEYEDLDPALKREGPDLTFVPDERILDGDEVAAGDGGWRLAAVYTPGHCSNHICYSLPQEQTLFTGDHVMGWATSVIGPPDGSMADYLASLRKLLPRQETRYWPTHGPAIDDPVPYVQSFLDHREEREEQILAFFSRQPATIADLVPDLYAAYDKRLWYPAAGSVYAHVLAMVGDGRLEVDGGGDPKLTSTYRSPRR
jgi:glyoxylase-like metal-dependent hydrolase (beta-lactamase superfamily II)